MNKKISLGAAIAYMALVAAVAVSITVIWSMSHFNDRVNSITQREAIYEKIAEIDRILRTSYLGTLDEEALRDGMAQGLMAGLEDPYARYLTAQEYQGYVSSESNRYVGIGVITELDSDGYIKITEVYPESPAQAAGIQAGGLIVEVEGQTATADNYKDLVSSFQGEAGTKIALILRQENEDRRLEITRRVIDLPTVMTNLLERGLGYIRFLGISASTPAQFERGVNRLITDGATALIFDIRGIESNNVQPVTNMLDILLPKGVIAYVEYQGYEPEVLALSDEKDISLPMMVLVDGDTKGASELFAQTLRDTGKARLVGTRTFGKGTLQEAHKLKDGSAVMFTVARYAGPSGESYDQIGVIADHEVRWNISVEERVSAQGKPDTDPVLKRAIDLLGTAMRAETNLVAGARAGKVRD